MTLLLCRSSTGLALGLLVIFQFNPEPATECRRNCRDSAQRRRTIRGLFQTGNHWLGNTRKRCKASLRQVSCVPSLRNLGAKIEVGEFLRNEFIKVTNCPSVLIEQLIQVVSPSPAAKWSCVSFAHVDSTSPLAASRRVPVPLGASFSKSF
jgi:hypothetical protein